MWDKNSKYIELTGHRGTKNTRPENTMVSFREALDLKVDVLEYDVHLCRSGELVIMHDTLVDRTTDGQGAISYMTFDEIQQLDAGIKFGEQYRGLKVPTLTETLDLVKSADYDLAQIVEIKDFRPECVDKIVRMLHEYELVDETVIEAGDTPTLLYIQDKYPEFKTLAFPSIFMKRHYDHVYDRAFGIAISFNSPRFKSGEASVDDWVKFCEDRDLEIFMFNGDTREQIDYCLAHHAKNITSNDPAAVIDYLRELGVRK